jgi:DNA-binding transcriptional regulator YiaG
MTTKLDFNKVEALRKHMLLSVRGMAQILRTSRQNYYNWKSARSYPTPNAEAALKSRIKKMLTVVNEHSWPTADIIMATHSQRVKKLLALLETDS